ncbi:hypothetical protein LXL04_001547 [Taraxacum kok-saghyz]
MRNEQQRGKRPLKPRHRNGNANMNWKGNGMCSCKTNVLKNTEKNDVRCAVAENHLFGFHLIGSQSDWFTGGEEEQTVLVNSRLHHHYRTLLGVHRHKHRVFLCKINSLFPLLNSRTSANKTAMDSAQENIQSPPPSLPPLPRFAYCRIFTVTFKATTPISGETGKSEEGRNHGGTGSFNDIVVFAANWGNCPKKRKVLLAIIYGYKAGGSGIANSLAKPSLNPRQPHPFAIAVVLAIAVVEISASSLNNYLTVQRSKM